LMDEQLNAMRSELCELTAAQEARLGKKEHRKTMPNLDDHMSEQERAYCAQAPIGDRASHTIRERASKRLAQHLFDTTLKDDAQRIAASRSTAAATHAQREDAANDALARCLLAEGAYRVLRAKDSPELRARYERGMDRFTSLHPELAAFLSGAPTREVDSDDKLTAALRREAERLKA
jgi:hypothetical protein